jgi:hypothetical protein
MHAAVRRYRVRDIDALVSKIEDEFADRIKEIDGFVGYYVIDGDDGTAASVTWVRPPRPWPSRRGSPATGCARAPQSSWTGLPR